MKPISTSTYSFEELRKNNCLYVDKTAYLYQLAMAPKAQIFCARPRRFGKSLMVSTMEALFQGKRELFQGLYIDRADVGYTWETYPVIHVNMADCIGNSAEELTDWLQDVMLDIAQQYGVAVRATFPGIMFKNLLLQLVRKTGKQVVLLLDEYDKPLTDNINNPQIESIRKVLEGFYAVIKGQEEHLRFTFITGVTKFSQVSIFSKLNNLTDISLTNQAATMFGYTRQELEHYFAEHLAAALGSGVQVQPGKPLVREDLLAALANWYDGYRFYPTAESVYNPVSVGKFFNNEYDFGYYWYATGTSQWLQQLARKQAMTLTEMEDAPIPKSVFAEFTVERFALGTYGKVDVLKLLYQTGYLTLAKDENFLKGLDKPYHLCFPNHEVREAYLQLLLNAYFPQQQDYTRVGILQAVEKGDVELLRRHLQAFFASIPYELFPDESRENTYQMMMYILFRVVGEQVRVEEHTNVGRIDIVLEGERHIFLLELKLDQDGEAAIAQIAVRGYAEKYRMKAAANGQDIYAIGVNFSSAKRNIDGWVVERL